MTTNKVALTLKPVLAAIVLGACSTTPTMPEKAWKIAPVQTVRHSGPTAAGFFALGRVKEAQGANGQALDAYRKALAADPGHAAAWNALGALQVQLGRSNEGLQALERAVSLSPSTSHLHNNLGYALLLAGRDDDAAKALRRAVELDGGNRRAWSNLATAYRRLGALDQAEFAEARASGRWPSVASVPAMATKTAPPPSNAPSDGTVAASATAAPASPAAVPLPVAKPVEPAVTVGTVHTIQPAAAEPLPALTPTESAAQEKADKTPPAATIEASAAALGFAPVSPNQVRSAASLVVTTAPRATLVKVAENVFELRNGPAPREAVVAEAAAIITAGTAPLAAHTSPVDSRQKPLPQTALLPAHAVEAAIPQAPAASTKPVPAAHYEISNGHGGEGLARRLAGLLGQQGFARPRLTNQRPFDQAASVLQYREGYRASAEAFASLLPFPAEVLPAATGGLRADVRLVLGHDLTTSDACAVLGLCTRVARAPAPKVAAAAGATD